MHQQLGLGWSRTHAALGFGRSAERDQRNRRFFVLFQPVMVFCDDYVVVVGYNACTHAGDERWCAQASTASEQVSKSLATSV